MATAGPISGVVVRVRLPAPLERIRRRDDLATADGAPSHVTLLFPFMPVARLRPAVRRDLAEISATVEPFDVHFANVGRFPGAVYLVPEPAAPFAALTAAIVARFPGHPPYEGAFDEVIPHLTIVESETALLATIAETTGRHLPFTRHISTIELLVEDRDGRWRSHWRIPLGAPSR